MTPEQLRQLNEMKAKLEELEAFVNSLKSSTTIPLEIDGAFRARVGTDTENSDKDVADVTVTLGANPSGVEVAAPPDGFVRIRIAGTLRTLPYYDD